LKKVKNIKLIALGMLAALFMSAGMFFWNKSSSRSVSSFDIQDFDFDRDSASVDDLFHKGDNWYWMLHNGILNTYSLDFMLRYNTSSQSKKLHNLIFKVLKIDGKLAGFLAYYPHSKHVWQLLFLLVDQDFRRQGIAKKLLKFSLDDMAARGALKVDLATRNNNFRSQGLYKGFGMKQTGSDEQFVFFSWYK
jgi:ribosomal protein S18 acetylase RimI-like enzyme